ncbi:MAG: hypothetical protein ACPGXY_03115 [Alphaproteobacteria bacterium]
MILKAIMPISLALSLLANAFLLRSSHNNAKDAGACYSAAESAALTSKLLAESYTNTKESLQSALSQCEANIPLAIDLSPYEDKIKALEASINAPANPPPASCKEFLSQPLPRCFTNEETN